VKCPPQIATPARAPDAPVDDVVGVRPGMTYDEAAAVVMCTNDLMVVTPETRRGFQIQTFGQTLRQGFNARLAEEKVEKTSKQIMEEMQDAAMARGSNRVVRDVKPGQSKWYVGTMGMPGQERVLSAAREEWFAAGRNPTRASVEQALREKYGTPTRSQDDGNNRSLTWAYDPFGRLITETSPLFNQCYGQASPDAGVNLSPDCGIVVAAQIGAMRDNPDLAEYLQASVVDQANGYEALQATEQALQAMENQRRAQQVEEAAKNADAPQL
jgi:YD repeat-containing protein